MKKYMGIAELVQRTLKLSKDESTDIGVSKHISLAIDFNEDGDVICMCNSVQLTPIESLGACAILKDTIAKIENESKKELERHVNEHDTNKRDELLKLAHEVFDKHESELKTAFENQDADRIVELFDIMAKEVKATGAFGDSDIDTKDLFKDLRNSL